MIRQWIEKYQQMRWIRRWLHSPQIKNSERVLSKLYYNINAHDISLHERKELKIEDVAYTYGEIDFFSFAAALKVCEPKAGEIFYDIGAGAGKSVFASALLYNFSKTCGVESLNALYQLCIDRLETFPSLVKANKYFTQKKFNIKFISGNLLNTAFEEADIIFINATCFIADLWEDIYKKINQLKVGSRIILASKRLKTDQYLLIDAQMAQTSWGINSVFIYKKVR